MVGIILLSMIGAYIAFATLIVKLMYKEKRKFAILFFIFLPIWDLVLHYPIYFILSNTIPEIERYQPYEKVEGYYADYIPRGNIAYNMISNNSFDNNYSIYFDKPGFYNNEKFHYRASWLNDSRSPTCFQPQPSTVEAKYIDYMNSNWCISVEKIEESEMTKYWKVSNRRVFKIPLLYMNIYVVDFFVSNRLTGEKFFRLRDVFVDQGWLTSVNISSGRKGIKSGTKYTRASNSSSNRPTYFEFPHYNIIKILDSKELPNI